MNPGYENLLSNVYAQTISGKNENLGSLDYKRLVHVYNCDGVHCRLAPISVVDP